MKKQALEKINEFYAKLYKNGVTINQVNDIILVICDEVLSQNYKLEDRYAKENYQLYNEIKNIIHG